MLPRINSPEISPPTLHTQGRQGRGKGQVHSVETLHTSVSCRHKQCIPHITNTKIMAAEAFSAAGLQYDIQLVTAVQVVTHVYYSGVACHESILGTNVQVVVDLPVDVTDFSRRMEETL